MDIETRNPRAAGLGKQRRTPSNRKQRVGGNNDPRVTRTQSLPAPVEVVVPANTLLRTAEPCLPPSVLARFQARESAPGTQRGRGKRPSGGRGGVELSLAPRARTKIGVPAVGGLRGCGGRRGNERGLGLGLRVGSASRIILGVEEFKDKY